MSLTDTLSALLPDLRRLAAALMGSPHGRADDLVLRALHQFLREPPPRTPAQIKGALQGALTRLAEMRPLPETLSAPVSGFERAMRALPAQHRAALMLVTVERCSYAEAAQVLGISRNVLIGRLASARHMMAQQMQEDAQGRPLQSSHLRLVR